MVIDTPNRESQLIPERHTQRDLFICDVADAVLKDVMPLMEHPFYSLSKKPETSVRRYEHNGNWLEIVPSVKGLATIYDKDILIYCISQIIAKMRNGEEPSQRVRINSRDLLVFTKRGTGGKDYKALAEALDRLDGTRIRTNIRTGDEEQFDAFGLIDSASLRRKLGLDGRLMWCEVKLSDWVFNAIKSHDVLTLHPDYFRLRKPLERRIYELARKHCGQQVTWSCGVPLLYKKSGSKSPEKHFRYLLKQLAEHDHLPDYSVQYREADDMVIFTNRGTMPLDSDSISSPPALPGIFLKPETHETAKQIAPGYDVYAIEEDWRAWMKERPKNPDAAFLGFVAKWYEREGPLW